MTEFCLQTAMERDGGQCQTRDGRPARIVCTDFRFQDGTLGLAVVVDDGGMDLVFCHRHDGSLALMAGVLPGPNDRRDLVNLPQSHEVTVQLYYADDEWVAEVWLDGQKIGMPSAMQWPKFGKPQTIRIDES